MPKRRFPSFRWRPIKTAPKDQIILLAQPPFNYGEHKWVVMQGRWVNLPWQSEVLDALRDGTEVPTAARFPHWCVTYDGIMEGAAGMKSYHFHESRSYIVYPTHWAPLPEPPRGRYKQPHY
jgi:hypothetical protein